MKKSLNEQKHIARRRKGAEAEKKTKQLFNPNLCVSASLREIVYFFTASDPERMRHPRVPTPLICGRICP